jgi:Protein of unknown function (DUF2568)
MQRHDTTHWIRFASFVAELAMLVLLAVTGARLGWGGLIFELALAIVMPLCAASMWGAWMAPPSPSH